VKALEARSYSVTKDAGDSKCLSVLVLGESISVWLEEMLTATERTLTPAQLKEKERNPWMYRKPEFDYHPNGRLALRLGARVHWERIRQTWSDSTKHRLENLLNSFVAGMVRAAERQRAERLDRERQEREWAEQRRKREEDERRQAEERQRAERLQQQVDAWDRGRRIRQYVAELKENALPPEKWTIAKVPLVEWMEWALLYADSIDPVAPLRKDRQAELTRASGSSLQEHARSQE
jgi:hypothetical protein